MAIKREGQWCPHTRTHRVDAHDVARLVQLVSSETGLGSLAATAAVAQLPAQLADARCVRIGTTAIHRGRLPRARGALTMAVRLPVLSRCVSLAALELAANDERAARPPQRPPLPPSPLHTPRPPVHPAPRPLPPPPGPRGLALLLAFALALAQDASKREPANDGADHENVEPARRQRRKWTQREPLPLPDNFVALDGPPPRRGCRTIVRALGRPCPFIECPMHLWSVAPSERMGGAKAKGIAVRRFTEQACAYDVIDEHRAGLTEQQIADMLGLHRRRVEQLVQRAVAKLAANPHARALLDEMTDEHGSASPRAAAVRVRAAVPRSA